MYSIIFLQWLNEAHVHSMCGCMYKYIAWDVAYMYMCTIENIEYMYM